MALYFSITKELGGSTDAELAAAIASVTSDAATLTAANSAADDTASADAVVAGQTFTLTTGLDEATGNGAANTFTAGTVNAKTGAAETTINDGDEIDGGAGTDTLNITSTAANNTSLTGLSVKNVEIINITGADNFAASTTATDAANAGVAEIATLTPTGALTIQGKVETIDFRDLTAKVAGKIDVSVDGATAIEVTIPAASSASAMATAVQTALNAAKTSSGGGITGALGNADSVTVEGSIVTINFKAEKGNIGTATTLGVTSGSGLTFESTPVFDAIADVQVATKTASTIGNEPVAKLDTHSLVAGTAAGDITIGNDGLKLTVTAAQTGASMATAMATAINGKVLDHEVQTLTIPAVGTSATNGGDLVIGGITVTLADSAAAATSDDDVVAALNGQVVTLADGTTTTVKASLNGTAGQVAFSFPGAEGNVADLTVTQTGIVWVSGTASLAETVRGSGVVAAEAATADVKITYGLGYGEIGTNVGTTLSFASNTGSSTGAHTTDGTAALGSGTATTIALSDLDLVVGGSNTAQTITYDATVLAGVAQGDAASKLTAAKEAKAVAATTLGTVLGDAATITSSTGDAVLKVTSKYKGVDLPSLALEQADVVKSSSTTTTADQDITSTAAQSQVLVITDGDNDASSAGTLYIDGKSYGEVGFNDNTDGTSSLVDTLNTTIGTGSASVSVVKTADAIGQIEKVVFSSITAGSTSTLAVAYGTATVTTAALDGTVTAGEIAALVKGAINSVAGSAVASIVGDDVIVTGAVAGADLPAISVTASTATDVTSTVSQVRASAVEQSTSTVTVTAPVAGTPLPNITLSGSTVAESAQNIGLLTSTTTAGTASVSGSQFVGAEQVWLKGSASNDTNLTVSGAQVAGLNGVTGIDGQTYTLGTASTLAISGATTATGKTANVKGGGTTLNIIGTGSTGFSLTETNTTDKMAALAANTSGSTVLTVAGLSALETVTQSGAGGLTLSDTGLTKVHTVTTGAGADKITMATDTAVDNVATAKDETVTAAVNTGGGADTLVLKLDGAGLATANTGAGDDTIKVNNDSTFSGTLTVDAGEGNDTIWLQSGFAELSSKVTVDGGAGTNTLALAGDTAYVSGDYTKLTTYASNIDALTFFGAVGSSTAVDGSKLGGIKTFTVTTGTNKFAKVVDGSSFTNTVIVRAATDYLGEITNTGSTAVTIDTADYTADTLATDEIYDAVYGQDVSITNAALTGGSLATTYTVTASDVTIVGASIGGAATASAKSNVVLAGQMETATVVLSSARGTTTNAAAEYMSTFTITTDPTTGNDAMQGLKSIVVAGSGVVVIDAADDANTGSDSTAANLKVINLAGMTDFEDLDVDGDPTSDTYTNLSTSTLTLNKLVAETVTLGGALDTVITNSTPDEMDSIVGFSLVATAITTDEDDLVDYKTSDVIDIPGTDYSTADNDADGSAGSSTTFVKDETAYVSKDAGLLELAKTANKAAVFHAEGNTYIFINDADTELDSDDTVIELVGTYDLDQLINVII